MRRTTLVVAATLAASHHCAAAFIPSSKVSTVHVKASETSFCRHRRVAPKYRTNHLASYHHQHHHHHKLTTRDIFLGSSPLFKFIRYLYYRTRAARWLRGKRRRHRAKEDSRGITKGFVDATHSPWARRFCTIYIAAYLLLSVAAYSLFFEKWSIIDALYFAVTTFTSVGYGDLVPSTKGGKLFTVFFAIYGISILGIALGMVGSNLVEAEGHAVEAAEQRIVDMLHGRSASQ